MPQIDLGQVVGPQGPQGETGPYFTPAVDGEGNISWTNNGGLVNPTTQNIKGPIGATPELSIGTVTTLDAGEDATVTITGTDEAPVLNFGIPKGETGEIEIDAAFSDTSTNPVQNKVITEALKQLGFKNYGFHISSGESDPSAAVTYLADAVGMTPAKMDFVNDVFDWGSWADAFFLPRPCMLKYDGTVGYYLDPNDYSKKADGTASDIADDAYDGNAMMEWGRNGEKIWYKIVPDENDDTSASVYIANYQADHDYNAWSFINSVGELKDHFYTPIYNGSIDTAGRLRSISGKGYADFCKNKTVAAEMAAAELNNPGTGKMWFTEVYADLVLIDLLLILIGKSLNTQAVFGNGRCNQTALSTEAKALETGTMDNRGLFYGANDDDHGVKVFGMENFWGNRRRRFAGSVNVDHVHRFKMTYGPQDGSSADGYNTTGDGYLTGAALPDANGWTRKMAFNAFGFSPSATGASAATYWCDYFGGSTTVAAAYPFFGGGAAYTTAVEGAFCLDINRGSAFANYDLGANLSCKPL